MSRLIWTLLFFLSLSVLAPAVLLPVEALEKKEGFNFEHLKELNIQIEGRKKPLDTYARESLTLMTGREKYEGFPAIQVLLDFFVHFDVWENKLFINSKYKALNEKFAFKTNQKGQLSPGLVKRSKDFNVFMESVRTRQDAKEKLTKIEEEALQLYQRIYRFYEIASGSSLLIIPSTSEEKWMSLRDYSMIFQTKKEKLKIKDQAFFVLLTQMTQSYQNKKAELFEEASKTLVKLQYKLSLEAKSGAINPELSQVEVNYNQLKPFRKAWIFYLCSFLLVLSSFWIKSKAYYSFAFASSFLAFAFHIYGFYLRVVISQRPPVTNMYESVIWVAFGVMLFSFILELAYKQSRYFLSSGLLLSAIALILADQLPTVLDGSIDPLVPVLRSNYWLIVHVLTITLSYAAFALAMALAHVSTFYYILSKQHLEKAYRINFFVYRAIQIGVVLLAAGTILGGVWANESWGRFWGWDPKEVWALIALLGYLMILHGRFTNWLRGFGLSVGAIVAFMLVLMAWYGVNFILGAGLHSYGFSSGGLTGVLVYLLVEFLFILIAYWKYSSHGKKSS